MQKPGQKRKRVRTVWKGILFGTVCAFLCLNIWRYIADRHVYQIPDYPQEDLENILSKNEFSEADYDFLFRQTGLSKAALETMLTEEKHDKIIQIQERFFASPEVDCEKNSVISWEEWIQDEENRIIFADLEDGDILVTPCSHTYGWRNGHAAIVVDAEAEETLESVVLGRKSSIQSLEKWKYYPCVFVLRLKDAAKGTRKEIAENAKKQLLGVDYGLTEGVLSPKFAAEGKVEKTNCSHLVWEAYRFYGYDLDSNGGAIVTPEDIAKSALLEPVQVVGINPAELQE